MQRENILYAFSLEKQLKNWYLVFIINMKIGISIFLIAIVLQLLPTSHTLCQLSYQLDGLCTSCSPPQTLNYGYCITPLSNCINQISPSLCLQCAAGYVLLDYSCVQAGSNSTSNRSKILQIYTRSGVDYRYQLLDYNLKQKYVAQLRDKISDISTLVTLPTTYGIIYALTYYNPYASTQMYRAEAIVDYSYNITEFSFGSAGSDSSNLIWYLSRKIVYSTFPRLQPSILNKVQQLNNNDYRLFFLDFKGRIDVLDVQKTPGQSNSIVFTTLTQLYYEINEQTVINYVFSEFPHLQLKGVYTASYYSLYDQGGNQLDYFKFIFDNQIIVIVQINGLTFSLYSYQQPDPSGPAQPNPVGGYLPLLKMTDPIYLKAYAALTKKYAFLSNKNVQDVRYQLSAGTRFIISLNQIPFSNDEYVAVVYQPINDPNPQIIYLYKNGIEITNTIITSRVGAYNYEGDSTFKNLYGYYKQIATSQINNIVPIYEVTKVVNTDQTIDYQAYYIWDRSQSIFLKFLPNSASPFYIGRYSGMGNQISIQTNISVNTDNNIPRSTITDFLKRVKPALFSSYVVISQFAETSKVYNYDFLTPYGTYFLRISYSRLLYISTISQTTSNLCSDLSRTQFTQNAVVANLHSSITSTNPVLAGYTLQLVQAYMVNQGINYRLLYFGGTFRYEFLVQWQSSVGRYVTLKMTKYDGGTCDSTSILVGPVCQKDCALFVF